MSVPRGAPYPYTQVAITFTNRRAMPANEVRFIVVYDGHTAHITDRGTFSQNVAIDHAFKAFDFPVYYGLLPERCDIEYVRYSDGMTWMSSASNPQVRAGAAGRADAREIEKHRPYEVDSLAAPFRIEAQKRVQKHVLQAPLSRLRADRRQRSRESSRATSRRSGPVVLGNDL